MDSAPLGHLLPTSGALWFSGVPDLVSCVLGVAESSGAGHHKKAGVGLLEEAQDVVQLESWFQALKDGISSVFSCAPWRWQHMPCRTVVRISGQHHMMRFFDLVVSSRPGGTVYPVGVAGSSIKVVIDWESGD